MSDVVEVKQAYPGSRYVIAYKGGALNGWSYPSAKSAQADLDNIRAAIAPDVDTEIARLRAELAKVEVERDEANEAREAHFKCATALIEAAEARALAAEARMGEVVKAAQSLMDEMRAHVDANDETAMILPRAQFNRYVGSVARIRSALAKEPGHDH